MERNGPFVDRCSTIAAAKMKPEELAGKFVIGELHKSEAPEYTAEYEKVLAKAQGKGGEAK